MSKKIIAACMALAAFAMFAVAASASAATLTQPTGTAVATGTKVLATNVGITKFTASGLTVECSKDVLTGEITKNSGGEIEGTIESAKFENTSSTTCTGSLGATTVTTTVGEGVPWCVKADNDAGDTLTIRGNSCSKAARNITFALDVPGAECKYIRTTATGPVTGTYTTDSTGDAIGVITPTGSVFTGESTNSFICPPSGSLDMTFTLEKHEATVTPMYIS